MAHSDLIGYTPNNAWNDFYKTPIELLYSTEARLFTGYFYLTPEELQKVTFNDKIYFLNAEWRLLDIQDGDITEPSIVKVKLLKVPYRTPSETPIPPNYEEQRKPVVTPTPTPTPVPSYSHTLPWSFTVNCPTCDLTGSNLTFYSPDAVLTGGSLVYSDSTLNVPLPSGRYLKDTGAGFIWEITTTGGGLSALTGFCSIGGGC
jgi:hypothetical protein